MEKIKTIHICLVSDQLLPNLIPALQCRPDLVVALASDKMVLNGVAQRFQSICEGQELTCELMEFSDKGFPEELHLAKACAESVATAHPGTRVWLNATGGTKTMMMAALLGFEGAQTLRFEPPIYCDLAHNVLQSLTTGHHAEVEPISVRLDAATMIAAHGFTALEGYDGFAGALSRARKHRELTRSLVTKAVHDPSLLLVVNWWLKLPSHQSNADGGPLPSHSEAAQRWLMAAADYDFLQTNGRHWRVTPQGQAYLTDSKWLEEYCALALVDAGLDEVLLDLKLINIDGQQIHNDLQIDALGTSRNRLLLLEAKTSELKISLLRQFAGVTNWLKSPFDQIWFASPVPATTALANRAAMMGINLCAGTDLLTLTDRAKRWVDNA